MAHSAKFLLKRSSKKIVEISDNLQHMTYREATVELIRQCHELSKIAAAIIVRKISCCPDHSKWLEEVSPGSAR